MNKTTIKISEETKKKLDRNKIIPMETYENVVIRLLKKAKK